MKKKYKFIYKQDLFVMLFSLLFFSLFIVSCKDGVSDEISPDPDNDNDDTDVTEWVCRLEGLSESIGANESVRTIKVYSNKKWRLSINKSWITLDKLSGDVCNEIPVEVNLNSEFNFYDDREAVLTLYVRDGVSNERQEYKLKQLKYQRPITKYQVGDPEVTFDESKFSENYKYNAQMQIWRKAGKEGGIPHIEDQLKEVTKVFEPGTSSNEIKTYFENNKSKKVVVLLKNGNYTLSTGIRIYSNAVLIGESRDGVIMTINPNISKNTYGVISLYNGNNIGLRNVTVVGGWLNEDGENRPKYDNMGYEELPGYGDFMTVNLKDSKNCYVDNVRLINNASHPIWIGGSNNTIRNVEIDGAFCKAGGCQGYFFIGGNKQLVTNCNVTRIRHISMQGENSKQNVFYDNDIKQEVSFHNYDGGDNLIENNRIYLPSTMSEGYNPIMGPWSVQHKVGGKNFIYKNRCKEDNREGKTPWSDDQLYLGPYEVSVGSNNPTRYTNFRPVDPADFPPGGTLYPVVLD